MSKGFKPGKSIKRLLKNTYWLKPKEMYADIRYIIRWKIPGMFIRANRGWAPVDTWNFDKHLANVLAGGLKHLAEHTHGYPLFVSEGSEPVDDVAHEHFEQAWKDWLLDKARWFEWYVAEDLGLRPEMTYDERRSALNFWDKQERHFYDVVLPDFAKRFGHLWD